MDNLVLTEKSSDLYRIKREKALPLQSDCIPKPSLRANPSSTAATIGKT